MRPSAALAACAAVLVPLAGCSAPVEQVDTLPAVGLERFDAPGEQVDEDAGPLDLSSVRGPAVVNLWASWCTPCRDELPVLEAFHREHGDRVRVIGVDYLDTQPGAARELAADSGLSFELLADPDGELDGEAAFPSLRGLPFWAVVDAEGRVVHREFVEVRSVEQIEDLVTEHTGTRL